MTDPAVQLSPVTGVGLIGRINIFMALFTLRLQGLVIPVFHPGSVGMHPVPVVAVRTDHLLIFKMEVRSQVFVIPCKFSMDPAAVAGSAGAGKYLLPGNRVSGRNR